MPAKIWKGAPRPPHMLDKPISPQMRAAMEAMKAGTLERFRRGYARDVRGPFFHEGTIEGLWKRGLVDYTPIVKHAFLTREGLAFLARDQSNDEEAA